MLVSIMASSTGKNTINTGTRMVPRPNPEKNVSKEPAKAVRGMIYSCKAVYGIKKNLFID